MDKQLLNLLIYTYSKNQMIFQGLQDIMGNQYRLLRNNYHRI